MLLYSLLRKTVDSPALIYDTRSSQKQQWPLLLHHGQGIVYKEYSRMLLLSQ